MIQMLDGRVGGGKTYSAIAEFMIPVWCSGGLVCTNVELNIDSIINHVRKVHGIEMRRDQIQILLEDQILDVFKHVPVGTESSPVLIVIDEAHLYLNARDWSTNPRELMKYLTQSRKIGHDLIFISQHMNNVDKQIMRLIQYQVTVRDLQKWKVPGIGIHWPFPQFYLVQRDYDGKTVLDTKFIRKDKRIYGLYNTNQLVIGFTKGTEYKRTVKKVKGRYKMRIIILLVGLMGFVGYKVYGKYMARPVDIDTVESSIDTVAKELGDVEPESKYIKMEWSQYEEDGTAIKAMVDGVEIMLGDDTLRGRVIDILPGLVVCQSGTNVTIWSDKDSRRVRQAMDDIKALRQRDKNRKPRARN